MQTKDKAVGGPVERPVRPAIIREYGHPDVVRGDAVAVAPGQRIELVLWSDMEAEVRRAVAAERERWRADAERWRWLADDVDGDAQSDFITWLHGHVAERADVDAKCDQMMAPDYRSPEA